MDRIPDAGSRRTLIHSEEVLPFRGSAARDPDDRWRDAAGYHSAYARRAGAAALQIARGLSNHKAKVTVFVPHYAMSGGTLIALAADEIVMSRHAVLGPIDPQLETREVTGARGFRQAGRGSQRGEGSTQCVASSSSSHEAGGVCRASGPVTRAKLTPAGTSDSRLLLSRR
jgi:Serine dehydrogenase proteinase